MDLIKKLSVAVQNFGRKSRTPLFDFAWGREVFREPSDYAYKYNCQAYAHIKDFAPELFRTPQPLPPLFREGLFEIQSRRKKKTLLAPHIS